MENINFRLAVPEDLPVMWQIFEDTIRNICKKDYSSEQIEAWVSVVKDKARWKEAMEEQYFLIAEEHGKVIGYGSLEDGYYIDFIYVHNDYIGSGVGGAIIQALEQEAIRQGVHQLEADVSITAEPFFKKFGFNNIQKNKITIKNIDIINYSMVKPLK